MTTGPAIDAADLASRLRPSILMLDDDRFMLEMLSPVLENMGYSRVAAASSAQDALHQLLSGAVPPDLIICDLNLPGMDGIEFLQRLSGSGCRASVVLLSGEGRRILHTVQKLLGGGGLVILGTLQKPVGRDALQAVLDCWRPPALQAPGNSAPDISMADFEQALACSQWVLHYQPKVEMRTGALSGVEALVRWNHPVLGLVGPNHFISLAEEAGAIDALTDWVLATALQQLATWRRGGLRLQMAVNVSMDSLRAPGFAAKVGGQAQHFGVAPQDVVLEITESRLMSPRPAPLENLVRLRLQRFQLSIDDFGTGHSSLVQLRDIPFTELKVDGSFVRAARHNQITRPMLEGSLGLARKLEMRSVAEGVETVDDWQLLRELDCDLAQGWFIGRAMAAEALPAWVPNWLARCPQVSET
jgi:EAL domain-containing protein (putative c-di-GMP-specific phosphodiesterase class I)/ActR/RegA family two-component response regulator